MNREQRNYQFDFLRPQHSLFNYFTKLVEQYTKVSLEHIQTFVDRDQFRILYVAQILNSIKIFMWW